MRDFFSRAERVLQDEEGASVVEYAVLASLIIAVCVAVILVIGGKVTNLYELVNAAW